MNRCRCRCRCWLNQNKLKAHCKLIITNHSQPKQHIILSNRIDINNGEVTQENSIHTTSQSIRPNVRFSYGSALKKKPKTTANTNTIQSVETGVPGVIIHFGTRPDKVCSYIWPFKNYHEQYAEIEDLIRKWGCNGKFLFVLCTYCRFGCIYFDR